MVNGSAWCIAERSECWTSGTFGACPLFKAMADHRMFGSGTENATFEGYDDARTSKEAEVKCFPYLYQQYPKLGAKAF